MHDNGSFRDVLRVLFTYWMKVVTFAYVNVYQYGTVELARNVIRSKDEYAQTEALKRWCLSKGRESSYVQIAAAILVAAASASLSTNAATESHWSCPAFWYSSIVLAIAAIFTGAQQALVLPDPDKPGTLDHVDTKTLEKIRRSFATPSAPQEVSELAMFAWQIPIMLLSYSVFAYLIGLCSGVISPLAHNFHWGNEAKIVTVFSLSAITALCTWLFPFHWIHAFDDLRMAANAEEAAP